jgi:hypothetical protein
LRRRRAPPSASTAPLLLRAHEPACLRTTLAPACLRSAATPARSPAEAHRAATCFPASKPAPAWILPARANHLQRSRLTRELPPRRPEWLACLGFGLEWGMNQRVQQDAHGRWGIDRTR